MTFNPRWLVGKTVAKVEMNPFHDGRRGKASSKAHDPIIFFTDGSSIKFATEETEVGEYGTAIAYRKSKKEGT